MQMNDSVITKRRKTIEIYTLASCFVVAFAVNLYAIMVYSAPYSELYSSIFYVVAFALVLYAAWSVIRLAVYGVLIILKKLKE